ncbi:MAG: cellulase family glycosylhydrolase [Opitutaceae bacterium]|nr:cellulase family glycosylhydrolase [Opitutaceae bacterium]
MTPPLKKFLALTGLLCIGAVNTNAADAWPIITRQGDKLMEGEREFRFLGLATPNLQAHEGDLKPDWSNRFPDEYEARDILASLQAIGSRATRSFSLNLSNPDDKGAPAYVVGHRKYNEEAFRSLDLTLALAREYDVRVIIPIIASQSFPVVRGIPDFSRFAGKTDREFWTDPSLKDDFKHYLAFILNRRNTVSGVLYKDDPAILAWQLGNEFDSFPGDRGLKMEDWIGPITDWSLEMAAFIKSIDSSHLVVEAGGDKDRLLASPHIDAMSVHLYEYWSRMANRPYWLSTQAREAWKHARGKKPLLVDEFGLGTLENVSELVHFIRDEGITGGLLWSLRCHRRYGGFYLHNEGGTPVDSFHWPGFSVGDKYQERQMLELIRRNAFAIDGRALPPLPKPAPAPVLYVEGKRLGWRGATHASSYFVEGSNSATGPWTMVAAGVEDSEVTDPKNPVFRTEPVTFVDLGSLSGAKYTFFRVRGANATGESDSSNVVEVHSR